MHVEEHPDAQKLKICQVDDGSGEWVQIVCGCPSVHVGQVVPLARVDAILPKATMKASKIRGVMSWGMLCSHEDLGLPSHVKGLWSLQDIYPLGAPFFQALGYDSPILVFEVTANRRDCLSLEGLVREWRALVMHEPSFTPQHTLPSSPSFLVQDCSSTMPDSVRAAGWLRVTLDKPIILPESDERLLRLLGKYSLHPVLNIQRLADIMWGLPLHVYGTHDGDDWAVTAVTHAMAWTGLDETSYVLEAKDHVVSHNGSVVAIAGILGGFDSRYTPEGQDIWFEALAIEPEYVHGTHKRLGLRTDAALRHARGIVPKLVEHAMLGLCAYLERIDGIVIEKYIRYIHPSYDVQMVACDPEEIASTLGIDPRETACHALETLGFSVQHTSQRLWNVQVPWYRDDIEGSRDLVEEIIRYIGYEALVETLHKQESVFVSDAQDISPKIHDILTNMGFDETIHYSFIDPIWNTYYEDASQSIFLDNPISSEMALMRRSLLPGMLKTAQYRQDHQMTGVALYEWGCNFTMQDGHIKETAVLGMLVAGQNQTLAPYDDKRAYDFYDLVSAVQLLMEKVVGCITLRPMMHPCGLLHPEACATVWCQERYVGWIAMVHPVINQGYARAYYAELCVEALCPSAQALQFLPFHKTPAIYRDLSFWVPTDMHYHTIEDFFEKIEIKELKNWQLIAIYYPEGAGHMKSISLRLCLSDGNKSLRDFDVEKIMSHLQHILSKSLSVESKNNENTNESGLS